MSIWYSVKLQLWAAVNVIEITPFLLFFFWELKEKKKNLKKKKKKKHLGEQCNCTHHRQCPHNRNASEFQVVVIGERLDGPDLFINLKRPAVAMVLRSSAAPIIHCKILLNQHNIVVFYSCNCLFIWNTEHLTILTGQIDRELEFLFSGDWMFPRFWCQVRP